MRQKYPRVSMSEIANIVAKGMCMSCGACSAAGFKLMPSKSTGMLNPVGTTASSDEMAANVCPGRGYDIEVISQEIESEAAFTSLELGRYLSVGAVGLVMPLF